MDESPEHGSGEPVELQGPQRTIYEALLNREAGLAEMYLGAITALGSRRPDSLAQSAHSLRELIEKLPEGLGIGLATATGLSNEVEKLARQWDESQESACRTGDGWAGSIDGRLRKLLAEVEKLVTWFRQRPNPRERAREMMRRLDPSGRDVPGTLGEMRELEWIRARGYFLAVSHHSGTDEARFQEELARFEGLLVRQLQPRPFADFDELDHILSEAERGT